MGIWAIGLWAITNPERVHSIAMRMLVALPSKFTSSAIQVSASNTGRILSEITDAFLGVSPTEDCTNPPSITVIKCVYWGLPVTGDSTTNVGDWDYDFHVSIAGSNGYVKNSIPSLAGYDPGVALGKAAINAPLDCNGANTYMGVQMFTSGPFDPGLCAAACSTQSDYNMQNPPENAPPQTCQFINTFILYKDNEAMGQYCALYSESWPFSFATDMGHWEGGSHFTIGDSYAFSNTTDNADLPTGCANPESPLKI